MITLARVLACIAEIAAEQPTYRNGGTAKDGTCDCVGLLMAAMTRAGRSGYPMHSSNYFARWQTDDWQTITSASDCYLGMLVYKGRAADINARYLPGGRYYTGDVTDYYHIGIVTGVNPLRITHCTSGGDVDGITVDSKLGSWSYGGRLKGVDYDAEEVKPMATTSFAYVVSEDGNAVKLRSSKNTASQANVLVKLPVETLVRVQESGEPWSRIECSYGGKAYSGYMMSKFLDPTEDESEDGTGVETASSSLEERVAAIEARLDAAGL